MISGVSGGTTTGPSTTWSGQTTPVLGDVQKVQYSTNGNYAYVYTPDLASYTMGPWWSDATDTQPFINFPKNQNSIFRVAYNSTYPSTTHGTVGGGPVGIAVNGVVFFNNGDAFSYSHASAGDVAMTGDNLWNRQAEWAESATFDVGSGHQPGNGQYHYHTDPPALRTQLNDNIDYVGSTDYFPYDPLAYYLTHGEGEDGTYVQHTTNLHHSPIIGWMFDGYPIYGPYGYSNPTDATSAITRMNSSFSLRTDLTTGSPRISIPGWSAQLDAAKLGATAAATAADAFYTMTAAQQSSYAGPAVSATYPLGRYGEDYAYIAGSGHLDQFNGRWCVTPEFPNGTYAYFDTIDANGEAVFLTGALASRVTITAGANNSSTLTLSGAIAELNAALASLTYTAPSTGASATLTAQANDLSASNNLSSFLTTTITLANAPPTIASLSAVAGPTTGGTIVTIIGTGIINVTDVKFGSTAATSITVNSQTQITVLAPAVASAGIVDVTVVAAAGTSAISSNDHFTYANRPAVASVAVNGGPNVVLSRTGSSVSLAGQHSVVKQILVAFNQAVTVASDAFTVAPRTSNVTVRGGSAPATATATTSATALSASEYLVTFVADAGISAHDGGILNSGVYDLTTIAAKVSTQGVTIAANRVDPFVALFGTVDANDTAVTNVIGDGSSNAFVDPGSLFEFSDSFGSNAATPAGAPAYSLAFDSNLDGFIDPGDLFAFSDAFGVDWVF